MTAATAWEILLSPTFPEHLRELRHADVLRRKLRTRAVHRQAFVHPRLGERILAGADVVPGGRHAAEAGGVPAGAGEHLDLYLRAGTLADLERQRLIACQTSAVGANTVAHIVDDGVWAFDDRTAVPLSVAWCDLADAGDRAADLVADRMTRAAA